MDVIVGWQLHPWSRLKLKLLNECSEKDEKLFLCQRLSQTKAFANSKWNYSFIIDEIASFVNETFRLEDLRVWIAFGVMVAVI